MDALSAWLDTNNTQCNLYQFFYARYGHYILQKTFRTWRGRAHIYRWFQQAMLPQLRTNIASATQAHIQSQYAFYNYVFPIRIDLHRRNLHTRGDPRLPILFDSVGLTFHLQRNVQDTGYITHNAAVEHNSHRAGIAQATVLQRTNQIATQSLVNQLSIRRTDTNQAYRNPPTYRFPSTTWSTARNQILYRRQTHPNDTPSTSDSDTDQNID